MKNFLVPLSLVVILCSCSESTIILQEEIIESTITSEMQTEPESTATITTIIPELTKDPASVGRLTYTVTENCISLIMNGKAVQNLELDYSPKENYISAADFDFDGYEDIFIPFKDSYMEGCYYRYNPDTEQFENWDKLNEIGYVMEIGDNDALLMKMYSQEGSKYITYKWKNDEISPILLSYYYFTSEGTINDLYEYAPDGSMILFERQYEKDNKIYKSLFSISACADFRA